MLTLHELTLYRWFLIKTFLCPRILNITWRVLSILSFASLSSTSSRFRNFITFLYFFGVFSSRRLRACISVV